ncbi:uncharacterized protein LOC130657821 [Hydractinia symbiolongicarpus]|uniref:uncharacterized protein LOC130657821 n=1 Tax=Hydractinia symbiolongicarpus TaxID=13093 RepID=UPI0025516ECE|nr:uncharacterized protein LOC130657821 [Hydractinia symbiolongicarpus]
MDNINITCSLQCRSHLQELEVKSADFNKLMTTDCGDNTDCPTYKHRIRRCLRGEIREFSTSNLLKNGCTRAYQRCQRNKRCKKMHDDMTNIHCNLLIPGIECTQECEKALMALTHTRKAKKYLHCRCDSSFHYEGVCHNIRNNALTLCKSKEFRSFLKHKNFRT